MNEVTRKLFMMTFRKMIACSGNGCMTLSSLADDFSDLADPNGDEFQRMAYELNSIVDDAMELDVADD